MEPTKNRPPDAPCPDCGAMIPAAQAAGGWAPEGFEPVYDHYWCRDCGECYDFEDFVEVKP